MYDSNQVQPPRPPHGFWSTAGWTSIIWAVLVSSTLAGRWFSTWVGEAQPIKIVATGIFPAITVIVATGTIERRLGGSWKSLGIKPVGYRSLLLGAIAGSPLLIAYYVLFAILDIDHSTVPLVGLVVFKFFLAQGVAEELVFRGFVFRRLRRGRSFLEAATLSAMVFALVHLTNFLNGLSIQVLIGVATSLVFAFVLAYPAALFFEKSGGAIWPFAITHVLIDSVNWFEHVSVPGGGLAVYLGAVVATAGWATFLAMRLLEPATTARSTRTSNG